MPRITKKADLLAKFEEAMRLGGWSVLYLTHGGHPARYQVFRGAVSLTVKLYMWNISHGGKGRDPNEYRIQVTGFDHLDAGGADRTLVLGWWDDVGVFGGWDIRQHTAALGASPSMQISKPTLAQAMLTGFAPYVNQKGETAIAIRPDFMGTYVTFLEPLHDSGTIPAEAALLEKLSDDPDEVADDDIDDTVAEPRKFAIVTTKKALRDLDFNKRVLGAYEHQCAMCGVQLRLIDGAHILPVAHADSTDATSNGVALCALHHRAYDKGMVTFTPGDFAIHLNEPMLAKLKAEDRGGGLKAFRADLRPILTVPADKKDRPAKKLVALANELRGWA